MPDGTRDIYVISDLHLGDFTHRDSFSRTPLKTKEGKDVDRTDQFRAFLDMVKKNNGSLMILGDMFEFWKASIGTVLSKNQPMLDELADFDELTVILGNHDNDLVDFIANPSLRLRESHPFFSKIHIDDNSSNSSNYSILKRTFPCADGRSMTIGFMHGHEVDAFNRNPQPSIGRAVTILAGLIQDSVGSPVLPESGKVIEEDLMDKVQQIPLLGLWGFAKSGIKGTWRLLLLIASYFGLFVFSLFSLLKSDVQWLQIATFLATTAVGCTGYVLFKGVISDAAFGFLKIFRTFSEYLKCWMKSIKEYGASSAKRDQKSVEGQLEKIEKIRCANNCDLIVMGHTHQDDIGDTVCNSGNWVNFKPSFLKITPNGEITLYRWEATAEGVGGAILRKKRSPEGNIEIFEEFSNDRAKSSKSEH